MKIHNDEKIIIIAIVVCVLAGLFGFSFAYFTIPTPEATGDTGTGVTGTTAPNVSNDVVYNAGQALSLANAMPGDSSSKSFQVQINTGGTATYAIKIKVNSNNFQKCSRDNNTYIEGSNECTVGANELVYTLKRGSTVIASGDLTEATGNITLATETQSGTVNYTLEVTYVDTNAEQNHNMNKTLNATLNVDFSE